MPPLHPALATPLLDTLGCRLPIMLAGMGGVARHKLVAAVGEAGGFGVLGMVREPVERITAEVTALRKLTQSRFAVNLIPASTEAALLQQQVATCLTLKVPALVLFWEVDAPLVRHLKDEGVQVIHQVGTERDADAALEAGADVVSVQGHEAGGHVRGTSSLFGLLPAIAATSPVPVVASGGIGGGRALAAALALGAQGASIGTAFLATHESNAHIHHQQRVLNAKPDDTIHTRVFARNWHEPAPVRVLSNAVLEGRYQGTPPDTILGEQDGQPVYLFSTDSPLKDATGEVDSMALYCGQSCGQFDRLCSAAERITDIIEEATHALRHSSL